MADEFRTIKALHAKGAPAVLPVRVAVLHGWGALRPWTLSGHFHETDGNILIHLNEALSGLPVDVRFISFEDVKNGALRDADVVISAGRTGDVWSGGDAWKDPELVSEMTRRCWVWTLTTEHGPATGHGSSRKRKRHSRWRRKRWQRNPAYG